MTRNILNVCATFLTSLTIRCLGQKTRMNPFDNGLWDAQGNVPSLTPGTPFTYRKDARLICEQIANLVWTQIPHLGEFGNGIVPLSVSGSRCLRCRKH